MQYPHGDLTMPKWRVIKDTGARPVGDVFELDRETMNHEFFERVDEPAVEPAAERFEVATPRRGRPAKDRG